MCYDRTSVDLKPMCASVCPSQALFYGTRAEIERLRPNSRAVNSFKFGRQTITTRVNMLIPKTTPIQQIDVTAAMNQSMISQDMMDDLLMSNVIFEEILSSKQ
jgi:Fe-S-cluster-containing dehydrogenase component